MEQTPSNLIKTQADNTADSGRDPATGRFLRGVSGNPHGRPQGSLLARTIRGWTNDGQKLAAKVMTVVFQPGQDPRVILEGATWLAKYGLFPVGAPVDGEGDRPNLHLHIVSLIQRLRNGEQPAAIDTTISAGDPGGQA